MIVPFRPGDRVVHIEYGWPATVMTEPHRNTVRVRWEQDQEVRFVSVTRIRHADERQAA